MLPSSPSADLSQCAFLRLCFGRAVFCCPFPGERGSTTAHLRRLPRKGRAGGAFKSLLKHRVQGTALPAMLPSSPSADYISDATLRLCFGRAVFCCPFPGEQGSTTAHLRRLPRKGRAGGAYKTLLKHRVQGAALPAMLPSSPSADYISVCIFTALLRQSRFLLPSFPENWGARLRISGGCPVRGEPEALKIFAQASRAKTKSMGLRLFCKLFMNPIDKVGE